MKNIILNEQYNSAKFLFDKAKGDQIFLKKKTFIDLSFCSGAVFLGHNHPIFKKSVKEYINKNFSIFSNPNSKAVELAKTIKFFFPKFDKIIFCNTGSESAIKALRISRATNKKKMTVIVAGSWHGSTDQTLFFPKNNFSPKPISAGLKETDRKNVIFIPYNDIKKSKKILDKKRKNVNCIIIEPIMGCLPNDCSKPYLKFLEKYCKKHKINFIFDEIITGFRTKKGSVQNKYKIDPDITLIGKVLGGGLPIGAIGISKKIYLKIKKSKMKVFFGGTFSANTFSTFIGNKVILYIKNNLHLINKLIVDCEYFQKTVNNYILKENLNARVYRFDSILRIVFSKQKVNNRIQRDFLEKRKIKSKLKFKKFLIKKNIYFPPNGIILLSLMTSKKNLNYTINTICEGLKKYCKNN